MTTLFHATSESAAWSIERDGALYPGNHGFAGGAIYFSQSPEGACRKYRNGQGNPDILIQCRVNLGNCMHAAKHTVRTPDRGYDSVKVIGVDVFAVYEPWRVQVISYQRTGHGQSFPSMSALRSYDERLARARVQQQQQWQSQSARQVRTSQEEATCFPANSVVITADGRAKLMKDVEANPFCAIVYSACFRSWAPFKMMTYHT